MAFLRFSRAPFYTPLFTYVMLLMQKWHMVLESPLLWDQSSVLSQMKPVMCFFWEVVGLERGPLSLVSTTEELTE
jgi:hypothetical protein